MAVPLPPLPSATTPLLSCGAALWAAIAAFAAGPMIYYAVRQPGYAHPALSFLVLGAVVQLFSALYLTRGFGITAWTHSLYDAFLLLG